MSKHYSLEQLAAHLEQAARKIKPAMRAEVKVHAQAIGDYARSLFGTYQPGWPALADSTQKERARLGYTPDDPLLRSGALRDAVRAKVKGRTAFVGVTPGDVMLKNDAGREVDAAKVMGVHENGTIDGHVPPRPVFKLVDIRMKRLAHNLSANVAKRIL